MARKTKPKSAKKSMADYRHDEAKRKNNPPAKIAAEGAVPLMPKIEYEYSPRLPPVLRFDPTGAPDRLPELLEQARLRKLTEDELLLLAKALRKDEPWLEWAGKRETPSFAVDPVALHIHERVSAQAILRIAAREDVQRDLFADPQQQYHEAVQFYQHDVDWANRLILGDSLQVMASLAKREDLAGQVQMIYIDPPYGIRFASNFQPEIGRREVKDKEQDLTREPEMVKAYRDTWNLGLHSYLSYLRARLIVARDLLADTGSIFVQIGDENLHHVRELMDDVFKAENQCSVITLVKTAGQSTELIPNVCDYLLWYAKSKEKVKFRQTFREKGATTVEARHYGWGYFPTGEMRGLHKEERDEPSRFVNGVQLYAPTSLTSQGSGAEGPFEFEYNGQPYRIASRDHWKTSKDGMRRLDRAGRIHTASNSLRFVRFIEDFPAIPHTNFWDDTATGNFTETKVYVVQTASKIAERCMLMTTDPGELVVDPTCGSGTTAYVAEQWGRRWITIDTSRVALSIARQRFMTSKFIYYEFKEEARGIDSGFKYKSVPHITLKSIAQNNNLDPIFAKHKLILDENLAACDVALAKVTDDLRRKLTAKLLAKQKAEGKKSITEADRRRWELPKKWEHWQVPFDTDEDWPKDLQRAVTEYRQAWRAKMDEVNGCIEANAEQEELVDQPVKVPGVVRVSGPFTVEAVQPPEMSLSEPAIVEFGGAPDSLDETFETGNETPPPVRLSFVEPIGDLEVKNVEAYLDQMIRLLRTDGVRFPNNREMRFARLERVTGTDSGLHAEGRWMPKGNEDADPEGKALVSVGFGPQYGPVTAKQVEDLVRSANRRGYDDLVIAGFSFDGPAQAVIEEAQHPKLRVHMANIRPDVNPGMAGLLKEQPGSQLFTVFGQPRTSVAGPDAEGNYKVTMEGVDIYNPVDNSITPTGADKVAAWFLDSDYDGWTFCITQAFFPDRSAWDKLSRALNGPGGVIDEERFAALSGTVSLAFPPGTNKTVAIKVIDPRGNEVMKVHKLTS
jgi:adenine-specific DNA-methyltransferase